MKQFLLPVSTPMAGPNEVARLRRVQWFTRDAEQKRQVIEAYKNRETVEIVLPFDAVRGQKPVILNAYVSSVAESGDKLDVSFDITPLEPSQKRAIEANVGSKIQNRPCSVCGEKQWVITESIFQLREFAGLGVLTAAGQIIPVVVVTCHICGHIVLFNAIHAGAVKLPEEQRK